MVRNPAIDQALDIYRMPSRVNSARESPLPSGTNLLLQAAVEQKVAMEISEVYGLTDYETIREAVGFYIVQILLQPKATSYRILGSEIDAPRGEIRSNMALLLRWLHPDINGSSERVVYVARVLSAWDTISTPEKREVYDSSLRTANTATSVGENSRKTNVAQTLNGNPRTRHSRRKYSVGLSRRKGKQSRFLHWIIFLAFAMLVVFIASIAYYPDEILERIQKYWDEIYRHIS